MAVDDVVHALCGRLCLRPRHQGVGADMSLTEFRLALGATELVEAVKVARISDGLFLAFTTEGRVTLGPAWRERCEAEGRPTV